MKPIIAPVRQSIVFLLLGLVFMALSSCAATYRDHGYVPTDSEVAEIVVGVDSRETVSDVVGVPSTAGILNDSGYYYVKSRVRHFGAMRPKEIEREVLAISFNEAGIVQNIERFSLQDGKAITLSRRVTESTVSDNTFLRQLISSIGRFAPGQFD
ncbi:outer membrane protein assembly factor BamE [Lentibacter sp. XHP0401]|jgi:outer membrane protein assembly factor BamE (lipoprotein component of BamABCDE complex)|uniref:outer membrane protein assembly factor BamE n=1 Tax=Lentibacter sp. XHP0401 TaxID=2984334 RepID=UPI0021E84FB0|nr:outer membrane protein assembly factor BamE [Lentibacter sp. XHP0401]MCV2891996.1 outer membrane protein assembly factor BamE [Lentibacter sp. XHP0401]